jgi:DNA-binding CsgD family transcriptional regulator
MDFSLLDKVDSARGQGLHWKPVADIALSLGCKVAWFREIHLIHSKGIRLDYVSGAIEMPRHYRAKNYADIDPVKTAFLRNIMCTTWQGLKKLGLSAVQRRMYNEFTAFDLDDALVVIHQTGNRDTICVAEFAGPSSVIESIGEKEKNILMAASFRVIIHETKYSPNLSDSFDVSIFTERERLVIQALRFCDSNHEIAEQLDIQQSTLEKHLANIRKKTGIYSRIQLAEIGRKYFHSGNQPYTT